MSHTNINIDAIEQALPTAFAAVREKLIQKALNNINIWLTPNSKDIIININVYHYIGGPRKVPLDIDSQRQLLENMFDNNYSLVFISKTKEKITKNFFGGRKSELYTEEKRNYVFTTTLEDLVNRMNSIKETLSALKNPRVVLSVKEHTQLVNKLKYFNIDLVNYYI